MVSEERETYRDTGPRCCSWIMRNANVALVVGILRRASNDQIHIVTALSRFGIMGFLFAHLFDTKFHYYTHMQSKTLLQSFRLVSEVLYQTRVFSSKLSLSNNFKLPPNTIITWSKPPFLPNAQLLQTGPKLALSLLSPWLLQSKKLLLRNHLVQPLFSTLFPKILS